MKNFAISALAAGTLAMAGLAMAGPAAAVPTEPSTVDQTVSRLQSQGYQVVLNKVGAAPLADCAVSAVRPGQTFSRTDSGAPGAGNDVVTTVTNKTVYVDVKC
jgi:NADPH:quinone reductase-like Zn-dependent oxidoreductase